MGQLPPCALLATPLEGEREGGRRVRERWWWESQREWEREEHETYLTMIFSLNLNYVSEILTDPLCARVTL